MVKAWEQGYLFVHCEQLCDLHCQFSDTSYKCHKRATVKLKMGNTHENKDSKDQSPALPFTSVVIDNVYATSENIYTTPVT